MGLPSAPLRHWLVLSVLQMVHSRLMSLGKFLPRLRRLKLLWGKVHAKCGFFMESAEMVEERKPGPSGCVGEVVEEGGEEEREYEDCDGSSSSKSSSRRVWANADLVRVLRLSTSVCSWTTSSLERRCF